MLEQRRDEYEETTNLRRADRATPPRNLDIVESHLERGAAELAARAGDRDAAPLPPRSSEALLAEQSTTPVRRLLGQRYERKTDNTPHDLVELRVNLERVRSTGLRRRRRGERDRRPLHGQS